MYLISKYCLQFSKSNKYVMVVTKPLMKSLMKILEWNQFIPSKYFKFVRIFGVVSYQIVSFSGGISGFGF